MRWRPASASVLGFTVTSKANIRVDILLDALPDRFRVVCDLIASAALAVIAVALAWFAYGTLAQSWALNAKSVSLLQVPMVIPQGIWCVGLVWFACMAVLIPIQAIARLVAYDRPGFDALIGSLRVDRGDRAVRRRAAGWESRDDDRRPRSPCWSRWSP